MRSGNASRRQNELRNALQSLHDWIESILTSRSADDYRDPNKQISSAIKKTLALTARTSGDRTQILTNAEWLGAEIEEEIEGVRHEEDQRHG
jgi:hypothetical protein